MEALVPPDVLDVGNDDNHAARTYTLLEHAINHTARSPNSLNYDAIAVPTTNYDAIAAAPACSLEWSTTAAACPPQSRSSFAHTAPTMGDGGQWAPGQRATTGQCATPGQRATTGQWATPGQRATPGQQATPGQRATTGQRATPRQRATPQQTSQWTTTLIAIGGSLSSNMRLWLDFVILSIEQLLHVLHTIRTAYRETAIVGRDASAAAAVVPNGENGLIESEAGSA